MPSPTTLALAELATQYWKLCEASAFRLDREGGGEASEAAALRYARARLDAILAGEDMALKRFDGEPWSVALPPTALNADEIEDGGAAIVARTLEPTILSQGEVILPGRILLETA